MKRIIAPTKPPIPVIWGLLITWPEPDLMKIYAMDFLLIPYLKGMKTTEWIVGSGINNPLFQVNECLICPKNYLGILDRVTNKLYEFAL